MLILKKKYRAGFLKINIQVGLSFQISNTCFLKSTPIKNLKLLKILWKCTKCFIFWGNVASQNDIGNDLIKTSTAFSVNS